MLSVLSLYISLLGIWFCSGVLHDLSLLWTKSSLTVCSRGWVGRLWFSISWISYRTSLLFCGSILAFFSIWVSMSHMPVSAIMISDGVEVGIIRIRFMVLP
jgi:hypothetical protein